MNLRLTLLKQIALITMIVGALLSPNIAEAASSTPVNKAPNPKSLTAHPPQSGQMDSQDPFVRLLTSKKAQKIEFLVLLGLIGLGVVVPEFFSNSQKNSEATKVSKLPELEPQNQLNIQPETIQELEETPEKLTDFIERLDRVSARKNENNQANFPTEIHKNQQQTKPQRRQGRQKRAA